MPEHDHQLLDEFARAGSEPAFATLVSRYVNLVYSTALRSTGNAQNAEDITQAVFIVLARKAETLSSRIVLSGWLYQTTRLTAANFMKGELRRHRRQEEAAMESILNEPTDAAWLEIAPLLDEVMERLGQTDRDAVMLRYFENKTAAEIGAALRMSEDTARRRVNRALEKLRRFFLKRGVTSTTATIAGAISANAIQAAPATLAKAVTATAFAKGATASTSTLTLIKGALKVMAWTKAKTAIAVGVVAILAAGTTTTLVVRHQHQAKARTDFPKSSWTLAGYAEPASALETVLWAGTHGDGKTLLASMTPDLQAQLQQRFEGELQRQGISLEEFFTRSAKGHATVITGFHVLDQQLVATDQVLLHVYAQGKEREDTFKMKKIGNEWKLDQLPPDY